MLQRLRSASRSRSRSRASDASSIVSTDNKPILVAVTSCRSDAYYNQKAPGSTSKLPRKAPSNLKLFHELAIGIKDAYAAVGQTPTRPDPDDGVAMSEEEREGRRILWEFVGNLDFLLALVDEVAVDTATRGALKDDSTFKSLRDVIKKCNKVLEGMLVRRERRFTLFFRLVQPTESKDVAKLKSWNSKVEKAVGTLASAPAQQAPPEDTESDVSSSSTAADPNRPGMFNRGRQLLPVAGRTRMRRATPTPKLRNHRKTDSGENNADASQDGFAASTPVLTQGNLALQQRSLATGTVPTPSGNSSIPPTLTPAPATQTLQAEKPIQPKDELIDVIKGLRTEQKQKREGTAESELANLKPNWQPKADIPSSVPKLPTEYIHRHRLMKQVVTRLLERPGQSDTDDASNTIITSITSRHADKPGNGKTTLAVAAIQTVEVRERFSDGIAWIQLGRSPLTEKEVRRLYEELFRQLVSQDDPSEGLDPTEDVTSGDKDTENQSKEEANGGKVDKRPSVGPDNAMRIAESRQRFQGGELEAIKEDLARIITNRKILICLDDVWRVDDAKWFIFDSRQTLQAPRGKKDEDPYRILVTTRTPSLFGTGVVAEVFVRIFSEHEAVKLLLSSAGRRPYGGKASAVFNQARIIVKGCGNSPLAVRLAGGMLRRSNRNWNIACPTWRSLIQQCRLNLEEASRLRSFVNSVTRVVDLSFASIEELNTRVTLRRCFISFAMCFRDNDWVHIGRGIPEPVLLKLFAMIVESERSEKNGGLSATKALQSLETMNLLQRARHGVTHQYFELDMKASEDDRDEAGDGKDDDDDTPLHQIPSYVMHDSIRAIGEDMANREVKGFLPEIDEFTSFEEELRDEKAFHDSRAGLWSASLNFISRRLSYGGNGAAIDETDIHELVVACLLDIEGSVDNASIIDKFARIKLSPLPSRGDKLELYLATFLPMHMMKSKAFVACGEVLTSTYFVRRRVAALGSSEATRRHMTDLLELRREVAKASVGSKTPPATPGRKSKVAASPHVRNGSPDRGNNGEDSAPSENVDTAQIIRDGARAVVDEVHAMITETKNTTETLSMAICLASVGEGLLKGKQPRDAMLRLEEAVIIFRAVLGQNNVDVARSLHSVARALVKLGENRVALHKFTEASQIYDSCDANMHHDSIANGLNLATLLVDLGEWDRANSQYEDVIQRKKRVYGEGSVAVAKTINSYAIVLAKHSRMDEALMNYIAAKETYESVPKSLLQDPEFDVKCKYDVTLINLNIASIRSKKGDIRGAIKSYEDGVRGLREYAKVQASLQAKPGVEEAPKNNSHVKHLVAALGRIGSLKLKLGDSEGALQAYEALLEEVTTESPQVSRVEKAKAYIKCATIFRQVDGRAAHERSISHLRNALVMYTELFGPEHKDTLAIAASLKQWEAEEPDDLQGSSSSIPSKYND